MEKTDERLRSESLGVIFRHFRNRRWVFQEDNAQCHAPLRSNQWKQNNNIKTLPWPPQSPNLNVIESVWKVLKARVQRRVNEIRTADEMKQVVLDTWRRIPLVYIRSLYQSLPRRIWIKLHLEVIKQSTREGRQVI